jgi:hypothetical protein
LGAATCQGNPCSRAHELNLTEGVLHERKLFYMLFSTDDQKEGIARVCGRSRQSPISTEREAHMTGRPTMEPKELPPATISVQTAENIWHDHAKPA